MPAPTKEYLVGRTRILLPANHALDQYQAQWPRYDRALGEIARLVWQKYPGSCAIDIGANVGDSAALISTHQDVPTLCIEGSASFIPFLRENARRIGPHVVIEVAFVGDEAAGGGLALQTSVAGTAKLAADAASTDAIQVRSLELLLAGGSGFQAPRLIKIDTDGFDFQIIRTSTALLGRLKPVLFYEYAPFEQPNGMTEAFESMRALVDAGYRQFMVYDNFGHFLVHLSAANMTQFVDLNGFLASNRVDGTAVYYFDICAFAPDDQDLFNALRAYELSRFFSGELAQPPMV